MYKLLATAIVSAFALAHAPAFAEDKPAPKAEEKKADAKDSKAPEAKKDDTKAADAKKDEQKKPKKGGC